MKLIIRIFGIPLMAALLLISIAKDSSARGKGNSPQPAGLEKPTGTPVSTLININNVAGWIRNDGWSARIPSSGNSGVFFPRGSSTSIFQDGIVWGGNVNDGGSQVLRVGGQTYSIGTAGGRIISAGVAADPNADNVRIYRIRRDWATAELRQDAAEVNEKGQSSVTDADIAAVRAQYEKDWNEWPATEGAPYYDNDGDGAYNSAVDEPGIADADQVIWFVCNDLNPGLSNALYGSNPIGLELQVTLWGYNRTDPLANVYFKKFTFIYKGTATTVANATITDMYACQWSDPDLGDFGDDYVGHDTTLSMAYVYNSGPVDNGYAAFGLAPPAMGYDFLQGPIVDGAPTDTAVFNLKKVPGKKNLPMTASFYFAAGSSISDPPFSREGTIQWYNLLQGLVPITGVGFVYPGDLEPTKFWLDGDPVTGTGRIDGVVDSPGDRRLGLCSGPFTMALGDTQEVVVGVVGGIAGDYLSSITIMKNNDIAVQDAYDDLFDLPKAPPSPKLQIVQLDQKLVLDWGFDDAALKATEYYDSKGYTFQGYNVYQLPSPTGTLDQAIKLGTFDVVDGIRTIYDNVFDVSLGITVTVVRQTGTDAGVRHVLEVNDDAVRTMPLVNGQRFYFAVTAYGYNPSDQALTHALESSLTITTGIPQSASPGVQYTAEYGDTVTGASHIAVSGGLSDGNVEVYVVDPAKLTGHEYKVTFDTLAGGPVWHLDDMTADIRKLTAQTNQSGDEVYSTVDGLLIKVLGAPNDFKRFAVTANGAGPITETVGFSVTPPPTDYNAYSCDWYRDVLLGDASVLDLPAGMQVAGGYYFVVAGSSSITDYNTAANVRWTRDGSLYSLLVPNDYEIRFTAGTHYAWLAFTDGSVVTVPFEIWQTGIGTPGDPSDDIRMIPWINDDNANGVFDFKLDHMASGGDNDPYTDWIYWMMPPNTTPGDAGYQEFATIAATGSYDGSLGEVEHMARVVIMNWNLHQGSGGVNEFPETGTIFRIEMTKPNRAFADEFTFVAPGVPVYSVSAAEADIRAINVFPNPYYGFNRAETSRFTRFVTFNHLPQGADIRIFNLSGALVRALRKDDDTQFLNWDLNNQNGLPVASGIYFVHMQLEDAAGNDLGEKTLKLVIIQEQQYLDNF